MPSQHRYPTITPRPAPELGDRSKRAVAGLGMTLNGWIIEALRFLVGDRPDPPPAFPVPRDCGREDG